MNPIAAATRQFVRDNFLFGRELSFSDEDSFLELGIIDSTGVLELVEFLESQYGVAVADDELLPENLDSIARLVGFVERKLGGMPACAATH